MTIAYGLLVVFAVFASSRGQEEFSDCLKTCLDPLAKYERSFAFMFNNYEKVCDALERGAIWARKCGPEDAAKFAHMTSFYRLYCVDFEEDIETQIPCLSKAATSADKECKRRCNRKMEKQVEKEQKMKYACSSIECSTVCYYQLLSHECPAAKDLLLEINLRQVSEMSAHNAADAKGQETYECRNIQDREYMRRKMIEQVFF